MNTAKITIEELRLKIEPFQRKLLQQAWEHFRTSREWPEIRALYSQHGTAKVKEALSSLNGSLCQDQNAQNGRACLQLTLIGIVLTDEGPAVVTLLERYFQFQRTMFQKDPKRQNAPDVEVASTVGLNTEEKALLGQLLALAHSGGSWNPSDGSWTAYAMQEAEEFPETGDLSPQVDAWVCRFYNPNSAVLQDQRHAALIGGQVSTVFVAMWFDPCMELVWNDAISLGVSDAGYKPLRIDKHHHNNRIDDEIIAKIRECTFLVADFTGARGGVYFEAGFALGLGKEVVWLVEEPKLDEIHFDTRQYAFILWYANDLAKLRRDLQLRIEATIGRGPGANRLDGAG